MGFKITLSSISIWLSPSVQFSVIALLVLFSLLSSWSVCYHVTYVFQSESTLYSCLNVKEVLARNRREIWSLSDKLAKLCVFLPIKWLWVRISLLSFSSWYHEINHYHCHKWSLVDCNTRPVFFIKYTEEKYPERYQKSRILICRIDCGFLLPLFNSLFQFLLFAILIANFDK